METIPCTHILANDALFYEAGLVALSREKDTCLLYGRDADVVFGKEKAAMCDSRLAASPRALEISRADHAASSSDSALWKAAEDGPRPNGRPDTSQWPADLLSIGETGSQTFHSASQLLQRIPKSD